MLHGRPSIFQFGSNAWVSFSIRLQGHLVTEQVSEEWQKGKQGREDERIFCSLSVQNNKITKSA